MVFHDDENDRDQMIGNMVVMGLSFVIIAAIVVGVMADVSDPNAATPSISAPPPATGPSPAEIPTVSLDTICSPTAYKDLCTSTLKDVGQNSTAPVIDYVKAAIEATAQEMKKFKDVSWTLFGSTNNRTNIMAIQDCIEMIQYGIGDLEEGYDLANKSATKKLGENSLDLELKNTLSATISYQESCIDELRFFPVEQAAAEALKKPRELASNALDIVHSNSENGNSSADSRRNLGENEEYPRWFSRKDRNLLEVLEEGRLEADAVVSKKGDGDFNTITGALDAYRMDGMYKNPGRYVIYVKSGNYSESVTVGRDKRNVLIYGDGPDKTIFKGFKNADDGFSIYQSAVFGVIGRGFICKSIGFVNRDLTTESRMKNGIGTALRVHSDKAAFFNCQIDAYRGSLHAIAYRQFYRECLISGFTDIIIGDSATVIQNSKIQVKHSSSGVTIVSQGRSHEFENTGFVIQNCTIEPYQKGSTNATAYLGRPWKKYARVVVMESMLQNIVNPEGWTIGRDRIPADSAVFAEYGNSGPGAATDRRVTWKTVKVMTDKNEALPYTPAEFIQGDQWLKDAAGIPFGLGLLKP